MNDYCQIAPVPKTKIFFVLITALIFSPLFFTAQDSFVDNHSPYVFIYKIYAKEAKKFNELKKDKTLFSLLHTKIDSFAYNSAYTKKLAAGYYLIVFASENYVRIKLQVRSDLSGEVLNNNSAAVLRFFNQQKGSAETGLHIYFRNKLIPFDREKNGYMIKEKRPSGDLLLVNGNDSLYLEMRKEYSAKQWKDPKEKWDGFVAFSKPRYLPKDTVKIKVYAEYKQKVYDKPLRLMAFYYDQTKYTYKKVYSELIKPVKPGAFETKFVCGDSLPLDQDYFVCLIEEKEKNPGFYDAVLKEKFRLEDYQLDEVTYSAVPASAFFAGNDSVEFILSAKDFNGMDVVDAKAEIKISTSSVLTTASNQFKIPHSVFTKEIPLVAGDETHFKMAATDFPVINARYEAKIKFSNGNNETKYAAFEFDVYRDNGNLEFIDRKDSLEIKPRIATNNNEKAKVFLFDHDKIISNFTIPVPAKIRLSPAFDRVKVEWSGKEFEWEVKGAELEYSGIRTKDSVLVELQNPRGIPIDYELVRDKKILRKGSGTGTSIKIADGTSSSYIFRYSYTWKAVAYTKEYNILPAEKTLSIELKTPETVFPGQETEVKIAVKDFYGNKIENANITVSSVNSQFGDINSPTPADHNKKKLVKRKEIFYNELSEPISSSNSIRINADWIKKLCLESVHFYKIQYPGTGLYKKQIPINTRNCQFAPFISSNGAFNTINSIYANDSLIFVDNLDFKGYQKNMASMAKRDWSFLLKPGKYNFKIRTATKEYFIENIELIAGYKLECGFDVNNVPSEIKVNNCGRKITKQESDLIFKRLFIVDYTFGYGQNYFYKDSVFYQLYNSGYILFDPGLPVGYYIKSYYKTRTGLLNYTAGNSYSILDTTNAVTALKQLPTSFRKRSHFSYYPIGRTLLSRRKAILDLHNERKIHPDPFYTGYYNNKIADFTGENCGTLMLNATDSITGGPYILSDKKNKKVFYYPVSKSFPQTFYNVSPGTYDLEMYLKNGNSVNRKNISVTKDSATYINLRQNDIVHCKDYVPVNNSSTWFSVTYSKNANRSISGKIKNQSVKDFSYMQVHLYKNQLLYAISEVDVSGKFSFEDQLSGFYQLYFYSGGRHEDILLYPVFVNDKYSAEIEVVPDTAWQTTFYILSGDKSYKEINHYDITGNTFIRIDDENKNINAGSASLKLNRLKTDNLENIFGFETAYQQYTVDDGYVDYFYHKRKRKRFRMFRGKSRFYRSSYSAAFYKSKKVRYKFGPGNEESELYDSNTEKDLSSVLLTMPGVAANRYQNDRILDGDDDADKVIRGGTWKDIDYFMTDSYLKSDSAKVNIPGRIAWGKQNTTVDIRSKFSDNAIWKPNLFTDVNGEVVFKTKYPDNITRWKNWAVAMADQQRNGKAFSETKAFKNIMATLAVPRFFVEGDSSSSVGKTLNYSGKEIKAQTYFKFNKEIIFQKTEMVDKGKTENITFQIKPSADKDSVELEYGLLTDNGISDGEKKNIPLYKQGVELAEGEFFVLEHDTTISIKAKDKGSPYEISCVDNDLDLLLEKLKEIKSYKYECNEQLASKLKALALEKAVKDTLKENFKGDAEMKKILRRLAKNQREDGTWGWWGEDRTNFFITVYILDAMSGVKEARQLNVAKGLQWMANTINLLPAEDQVYALTVLSENNYAPFDFSSKINELEKEKNLSLYSRIRMARIKQKNGLEYIKDIQYILSIKKETILGGAYWGNEGNHVRDNYSTMTALVYRILKEEGKQKELLRKIRLFFMEHSNKNIFRNTVESATILQNILPDVLTEYKKPRAKIELNFSGDFASSVKNFPLQSKAVSKGENLVITKKGSGPAYFSLYTKRWVTKPQAMSEYFEITSQFEKGNNKIEQLKSGDLVTLKVSLTVKKKCDFVMLEIPIPAGCSYHSKIQPYSANEMHREYYKEKTNIYCETLQPGTYTYEIELEPRFNGTYFLNPAKAELMYFPVFKGVNEIRKVRIAE